MSTGKESAILQDGIKKIDSHLVNVAFRLEDAKIATAYKCVKSGAKKSERVIIKFLKSTFVP